MCISVRRILRSCLLATGLFVCAYSTHYAWNIYVRNHGYKNSINANNITARNIYSIIMGSCKGRGEIVRGKFIQAYLERPVRSNHEGVIGQYADWKGTISFWLFIITVMFYILGFKCKVYLRCQILRVWLVLIIGFILFIMGQLISYIYLFSEYEGGRLASFERYVNIYLAGYLLVAFVAVLRYDEIQTSSVVMRWRCAGAACVLLGLWFGLSPRHASAFEPRKWTLCFRERNARLVEEVRTKTPPSASIYIVWQNTSGLEYYITAYEISPRTVNRWGDWALCDNVYSLDSKTSEAWSVEILADRLMPYDYLLLGNVNSQFASRYGCLFDEGICDKNKTSIYKIKKINNSVKMYPMSAGIVQEME